MEVELLRSHPRAGRGAARARLIVDFHLCDRAMGAYGVKSATCVRAGDGSLLCATRD